MTDYTKLSAREFYYDSPRQRYLDRDVAPETWAPIQPGRWTDYAGQQPYADFTHSGTEDLPIEQTSYFGGHAQQTVSTGDSAYRHGDLIASTMLTTDDSASAAATLAYTAFGEPIGDPGTLGTRYQYAGAWGYESGLLTLQGPNTDLASITLQHVGARWYQPAVGRFIQRDPIGLSGGLNLYTYCDNEPLSYLDPPGLRRYKVLVSVNSNTTTTPVWEEGDNGRPLGVWVETTTTIVWGVYDDNRETAAAFRQMALLNAGVAAIFRASSLVLGPGMWVGSCLAVAAGIGFGAAANYVETHPTFIGNETQTIVDKQYIPFDTTLLGP